MSGGQGHQLVEYVASSPELGPPLDPATSRIDEPANVDRVPRWTASEPPDRHANPGTQAEEAVGRLDQRLAVHERLGEGSRGAKVALGPVHHLPHELVVEGEHGLHDALNLGHQPRPQGHGSDVVRVGIVERVERRRGTAGRPELTCTFEGLPLR